MKMSTKILLGFVSIIVLLVVVGGVATIFLTRASSDFVQYREWARDSNLIANFQESLLMVRMNVKDFIISGDEKEKQEYQEYMDLTDEYLTAAEKSIQAADRAPLVSQMRGKIDQYDSYFNEVTNLQAQRDEIVFGTMDITGPQAEQDLTNILRSARDDGNMTAAYYASLATRELLLARLYAFKFLDTNTQDDLDRVNTEINRLEENLSILDSELNDVNRRQLLENAQEQIQLYEDAVASVASVIFERNDYINNYLDVIGPEVADLGVEVMRSIQADQDRLGPQVQANNRLAVVIAVAVSIFSAVLGIFLAIFITRGILKQLGADPALIEDVASRVAQGDLDIEFDQNNIRGVYESVYNMVEALRYKANIIERIAEGDLTNEIKIASEKDGLGTSLVQMSNDLNDLLGQVKDAVNQVSSGASQVSQSSQSLSQGATEQASSLEEISSSLTEINSQSKQNAENATEANGIATAATDSAKKGNDQMQALLEAMQKIDGSSNEIQKVTKVIDDIAFQINLLALNANVEAARAGKYGKGFAVVAEEVRNLAVRSAEAVKETTAMVEESIQNASEGKEAAELTASQLSEIAESVTKVADFLGEIAAASNEQAQGVEQVSAGLEQIDQVTQANTASAEESASASEELSSQAQQLEGMIARFKLKNGTERVYVPQLGSGNGNGNNHGETRERNAGDADAPQDVDEKTPVAIGAPANSGNGNWASATSDNPKEVIRLDDDDFGRF